MPPLVSIITVNYNDGEGLARTIQSVLAQDHADLEYLVIDGGSADDSRRVINDNAGRLAYWVSEKDRGIYHAMNKGIARASGEYLMFLNSGDSLRTPAAISEAVARAATQPAPDVVYGNVAVINKSSTKPDEVVWSYPARLGLTFFKKSTLNHQASLLKATLFAELGSYNEHSGMAADYELFVKATLANKIFAHVDAVLVNYDAHGISATESYAAYAAEMQRLWQELVPPWARQLVDENEALMHTAEARLVRFASLLNRILRKAPFS